MKVIFFSKRRPMGRDLITRSYGRFFHLPRLMAAGGHQVFVVLLSYERDEGLVYDADGITWISESLWPTGPLKYLCRADALVRDLKPDWLVGFSDTYYGILAVELAKKHGVSSAVDAYDNFESYIGWLQPLHRLWRKALAEATVVTAAGPQLGDYLDLSRPQGSAKSVVVPMAADPTGFVPMNRTRCRIDAGLPPHKKLVGYCGSLNRNRGVQTIFQAFDRLREMEPETELVLTGRKGKGVQLPSYARWLGYVSDDRVPIVLNSVDVLMVVNQLSNFGNYSYPVKLYEAMNCGIPVVASDTPSANWILGNRREFLARPGDPLDFAEKVGRLLHLSRIDYGTLSTWEQSCEIFVRALLNGGDETTSCRKESLRPPAQAIPRGGNGSDDRSPFWHGWESISSTRRLYPPEDESTLSVHHCLAQHATQ